MVTPKEYTVNLKNGIVTTEMMKDALFSVNKRAKNYRDAERECRALYHGMYSDKNCMQKELFYAKKEKLLSYLQPICIHREFAGYKRVRVYDYQQDYRVLYVTMLLTNRIVWQNSYFDYNTGDVVSFFDYLVDEPKYRYYLYYVCGTASFHSPIEEAVVGSFSLDVIDIGELCTEGYEPVDLMSVQFVDKLLSALSSGAAVYQQTMENNPPKYPYEAPVFDGIVDITCDSIRATLSFLGEYLRTLALDFVSEDMITEELVSKFRLRISIKQKWKHKTGIYTQPMVSVKTRGIVKLFKSDDMVAFLYDNLHLVLDIEDVYDQFITLCFSDESPIYSEWIHAVLDYKAKMSAKELVTKEANRLYSQNQWQRIVMKNGLVMYEDVG